MGVKHITYQNEVDGFRTKYDLCVPTQNEGAAIDVVSGEKAADWYEQKVARFLQEYSETEAEIENLTNHADGVDYAIAVSAGIVTGIIDAVFVGEWNFKEARAKSNEEINRQIIAFAKKNGVENWAKENKKDPDRLLTCVSYLESHFALPGDGDYKPYKSQGISDKTHHLDDFCHHPTLIGLICCIAVQFSGSATYRPSSGAVINVPVEVNKYGKFVSEHTWGKVFSGVINWFFHAAETIKNRKGHLYSDMAGSETSISNALKNGKNEAGMGLPGTFLSTAKELASLPCFRNTNFSETLRKAYQNGIGTGKKQVDLGIFNQLFEGASSRFDLRTEMAIGHELKRQKIPVLLNEIIVRGVYFIRRFIQQMKEKESLFELDWRALFPARNRTIVRMLTISSGTFTAIDLADAAVRAAVKSGGATPTFLPCFILRVNFVGIGRTSVAIGSDVVMGIQKGRLEIAAASADVAMVAINEINAIDQISTIQAETQIRLDKVTAEIEELSKIRL